MSYPIEVISLGNDNLYDDILAAGELLNSAQREFSFSAPPVRLRGGGYQLQPRDAEGYHTQDAFEHLRRYRKAARGHRPFLIGVVNGKLRSDRLGNLFASHEAKEGLAVVSLEGNETYTESRLQFLSYYPGLTHHNSEAGLYGKFRIRTNSNFCRTVLRLSDSVVTNTAHCYSRTII